MYTIYLPLLNRCVFKVPAKLQTKVFVRFVFKWILLLIQATGWYTDWYFYCWSNKLVDSIGN